MLEGINSLIDILNTVIPRLKKCSITMLNGEKIEALPELISLLKPFEEATKFLSESSYPSISLIIPTVKGIHLELEGLKGTIRTSVALAFLDQLKNFMRRLSSYEERTSTRIATLLDPLFKEEKSRTISNGCTLLKIRTQDQT